MSTASTEHESRVQRFRSDLAELDARDFIRKHITTGMPVEIAPDDYYELRRLVAKEFGLHPSAVILVGSCRTGFSIRPKKRYHRAHPASDLDVAMVSREQFDHYWDGVFEHARCDAAWKRTGNYRCFVDMLFDGWIDPRGLPTVPTFSQARQWVDFFDGLMRSRRFGSRRITGRLYRNWDRLESYQEIGISSCHAELDCHNRGNQIGVSFRCLMEILRASPYCIPRSVPYNRHSSDD